MGFAESLSYLKTKGTARFTLNGVVINSDKPVVLIMRHTDDVPEYTQAIDRYNAAKPAGIEGQAASPEQTRLFNEFVAKQYAKHIVEGWENVYETPGVATPCTPDKVEELLLFLLATRKRDIFLPTINFAYAASSFTDAPVPNAAALGKG